MNMTDNKHPHHDLIVEWAKDTSKQPQIKKLAKWEDCRIHAVISNPSFLARFKPREFIKGHWYPCLDGDYISVKMWNGSVFTGDSGDTLGFNLDDFTEVGESLGEIKFEGAL